MRTIETTIYQFDELSDSAKERARELFRRVDDLDVSDIIEDFAKTAAQFGLDIHSRQVRLMNGSTRSVPSVMYTGFNSQGDGASYEGSYAYEEGAIDAVTVDRPTDAALLRIVRTLADVQRRNLFRMTARITRSGRYVHSGTMSFDIERTDGIPISADDEDTIREALRDFADWMYTKLQDEYDFRNSDECIDEIIRINEYEFTADGRIAV